MQRVARVCQRHLSYWYLLLIQGQDVLVIRDLCGIKLCMPLCSFCLIIIILQFFIRTLLVLVLVPSLTRGARRVLSQDQPSSALHRWSQLLSLIGSSYAQPYENPLPVSRDKICNVILYRCFMWHK